MAKRARRLDLDMNVVSVRGLEIIRKVLENEQASSQEKGKNLQLLFWITQLKFEIKQRTGEIK
jgi:hypothetical protein